LIFLFEPGMGLLFLILGIGAINEKACIRC
jgi:hypothetical protein